MLVLYYIFVMTSGLLEWERICVGVCIACLYMYCRWRSCYQKWLGLQLTDLATSHICACTKIVSRYFQTPYNGFFFFCAQLFEMRDRCSYCCYCYICNFLPSLFKLSFHNNCKFNHNIIIFFFQM